MSHLAPIFAPWGNNAEAMAADIGEPGVKVRQWRNRGNIPPRYWPRIVEEAEKKGTDLPLSAFLPPHVAVCGRCELAADRPEIRSCTDRGCPMLRAEAA